MTETKVTTRQCFALDLKDDQELIERYKHFHSEQGIWPEIPQTIKDAGIESMEIYLVGNRLMMITEVNDQFNAAAKAEADANNERVVQWEALMDTFQQRLPFAKNNEKWVEMELIFKL